MAAQKKKRPNTYQTVLSDDCESPSLPIPRLVLVRMRCWGPKIHAASVQESRMRPDSEKGRREDCCSGGSWRAEGGEEE